MTHTLTQDNTVPLVSILCRSVGRTTLTQALDSVSAQDWPRLEVILVDALGKGAAELPTPAPRSDIALTVISRQQPLDRPAAANAALDAAQGEYLLFLDDDDWIAPDHISQSVQLLQAHPEKVVSYCVTRKTLSDGTLSDEVIAVPFNHAVLRRDNFVPIHAALFRRSLLDEGCRFDETLPVYEDWDFWLQAAEHGAFLLAPHEGAYYRMGGDSQTMLEDYTARYDSNHPMGQARARVLHKWRSRWSGQDWNTLLGVTDRTTEVRALQEELQQVKQHAKQVEDTLKTELDRVNQCYKTLHSAHMALQAEHETLHQEIRALLNSTSWRLTAPVRWLRRKLQRHT